MRKSTRTRSALACALALLAMGCTPQRSARPEPAPVVAADALEERPDFARAFDAAGVMGTLVVYDPADGRTLVHDAERARERLLPASTFKVLNSLIALETGVVADTNEAFRWDGTERSIPQWNRDHTLATAFENSVVWAYQDIARRIGEARMEDYVARARYGNADIGGGIDRFWLTGDLRISALEQVDFLRRLHERRLPFAERTVQLVEGIMVEERRGGATLHAKSGWAALDDLDPPQTDIGWYVGFVEQDGQAVYFALNVDLERPEQAGARKAVVLEVLADLGVYGAP